MDNASVLVIGAGTSGLSAAVALADRGIASTVLDQADHVGTSWRNRYDRLRLNTGRQFSHLPGRPYARGTPTHPTREQVVAHLERHAGEAGIDLQLGRRVRRIDQIGDIWQLDTTRGMLTAPEVVVATGYDHEPAIPNWPGRDTWQGNLTHSAHYRNPTPFQGQRVLVVGAGSSGMEIACDLATGGTAHVWLAVRTPPNIMLRQGPAGLPGDVIAVPLQNLPIAVADAIARLGRTMTVGDLSEFGLPVPREGIFARSARLGVAPAIVDPEVITAIRERRIEVVAGVEALTARNVALADGTRITPDAIVCATGYRRGLADLVGHLGVLDEHERPLATGADPAAPGLRFIGFVPRAAQIGFAAKQARRAARAIARELRRPTPPDRPAVPAAAPTSSGTTDPATKR